MKIDIYVSSEPTDPATLVTKAGVLQLPLHPTGGSWEFFLTTCSDDELLPDRRFDVIEAFKHNDYFLLER